MGATPPPSTLTLPPNGGNGVIRGATRRRHADSQLLMLQNPHRLRDDERRNGRRVRPQHPKAAARSAPDKFRMQFPRAYFML